MFAFTWVASATGAVGEHERYREGGGANDGRRQQRGADSRDPGEPARRALALAEPVADHQQQQRKQQQRQARQRRDRG